MTAPKKETVYYKPLPSPDIRATLERHLGGATWDDYKSAFKKTEDRMFKFDHHLPA